MPVSGYRLLPHTADVIVEAWAPTRTGCLRHAVRGLTAVFADPDRAQPTSQVALRIPAQPPTDLLLDLLDEVLYHLDTADAVTLDATITPNPGGDLQVQLATAPAEVVDQRGAVPKAIPRDEAELTHTTASTWRCRFTVDV